MDVRLTSVAALIVLALQLVDARQDAPGDPAVVVTKAWAILTSALESGPVSDQGAAVRALLTNNAPRARNLIERILSDKSHRVRSSAISMLPSGEAIIPLLTEALQDGDLDVRRSAIQQLGRIKDTRALTLLQDLLMKDDVDTVEYAESAARQLGPMAFGVLLRAVDTGTERSREAAARCIDVLVDGWVTPEATENLEALRLLRPARILVKALGDSNAEVRAYAALVLARLNDAAAADELVRMVQSTDPKFGTIVSRHYAMAALHLLGRPGYLAPLAADLAHPEQRVRLDAAYAMRSFVHPSMDNVLNATWRGGSFPDVRYWAFHSLIAIRPADVALLRAGLLDAEPSVRLRAAERLLALGPDSASVDVLERLAAEPATRNLSLAFLSTTGDARRTANLARSLLPKSVEDLARMRGHHVYDPEYWLSAVYTLEVLRDRDSVSALGAILDLEPDAELSYRIVRALVAINDDHSRQTLVRAMGSPSSPVRIAAAGGVITVYAAQP